MTDRRIAFVSLLLKLLETALRHVFNVTYARRLCKKNTQDNQASFIAIVQKNRHQAIKWLLISKALTVLSSTREYECVVGQLWLPNIIP